MVFKTPLTNNPEIFEINMSGVDYLMTVRWNDSEEGGWFIDLADAITGSYIVQNLPLVTGANLLEGLDYLNFNATLFIVTDGDILAPPTFENLGVESNLYLEVADV